MAENKKRLTISQQVQELIYDIQNKAYLTGQAREAEGSKNYEAASNMQASDDEDNIYQIRRSLATAFATLKSVLSEYLSGNKTTSDNRIAIEIEANGELRLEFIMPSNYNTSAVDALGSSIHAYLVDTALGDWFTITNKEDAEIYITHSAMNLENVKRALYKRSRPARPTYQ